MLSPYQWGDVHVSREKGPKHGEAALLREEDGREAIEAMLHAGAQECPE
jgi:hypothetical protein